MAAFIFSINTNHTGRPVNTNGAWMAWGNPVPLNGSAPFGNTTVSAPMRLISGNLNI
jgi:acetyl-CoA acetyltransferase